MSLWEAAESSLYSEPCWGERKWGVYRFDFYTHAQHFISWLRRKLETPPLHFPLWKIIEEVRSEITQTVNSPVITHTCTQTQTHTKCIYMCYTHRISHADTQESMSPHKDTHYVVAFRPMQTSNETNTPINTLYYPFILTHTLAYTHNFTALRGWSWFPSDHFPCDHSCIPQIVVMWQI